MRQGFSRLFRTNRLSICVKDREGQTAELGPGTSWAGRDINARRNGGYSCKNALHGGCCRHLPGPWHLSRTGPGAPIAPAPRGIIGGGTAREGRISNRTSATDVVAEGYRLFCPAAAGMEIAGEIGRAHRGPWWNRERGRTRGQGMDDRRRPDPVSGLLWRPRTGSWPHREA